MATPKGKVLARRLTASVRNGHGLLVTGPNGSGAPLGSVAALRHCAAYLVDVRQSSRSMRRQNLPGGTSSSTFFFWEQSG